MGRRAVEEVLKWSGRQSWILSGGGVAERVYASFGDEELPHHYVARCGAADSVKRFFDWRSSSERRWPLVGAFRRPLFFGGGDFTTEVEENCCNVQTSSIFVDVRIPTRRDAALSEAKTKEERLRILSRQHAFAGITVYDAPFATRHHLIDWNYLGRGVHASSRTRPNKWRVEALKNNTWKESSYARGDDNQSYYFELWRKRSKGAYEIALASLRGHCVFVLGGDTFAYALDNRTIPARGSCAEAVDRDLNSDYIDLLAGHGRTRRDGKLKIDASLQPEHQGRDLSDLIGLDITQLMTHTSLPRQLPPEFFLSEEEDSSSSPQKKTSLYSPFDEGAYLFEHHLPDEKAQQWYYTNKN